VDVGGRRKGFDVAVVEGRRLVRHARRCTVADVVALAREHEPAAIGVDAPCGCAPAGALSRADERARPRRVWRAPPKRRRQPFVRGARHATIVTHRRVGRTSVFSIPGWDE